MTKKEALGIVFFLRALVQRESGGSEPAVRDNRQAQRGSLSGSDLRYQ